MALPTSSLLVGVDTGGTYTDAVLVEAGTHRVVASAKALTTRGDLAIGVCEAMDAVLAGEPGAAARVDLVSVSTTLATNAVVEGHGSPVCVVLIGFDRRMVERSGLTKAFSGLVVEQVGGGHDHNGAEACPLDLAALDAVVDRHGANVEAFAVAAQFAVRNPAHEHAARERITARTGRPVTVSSELASALDAPRRALTAALNARLISRISQLVGAVSRAMARFGIAAPLMITKGDGTLALAETVALRPIETVLSGPAASLVGAASLSGLTDFILSDMGGTTTDLGVLTAGRPVVSEQGAEVGGWRTMVKAIDVRTIGLGGDSEVAFAVNGAIAVGPRRSVPVALIGARFPEVLDQLEADLADAEAPSLAGRFVMLPLGADAAVARAGLSPREAEMLALIGERPRPLRRIAASSGGQRTLETLARKGHVQIAGFTPSDAAHVLGLQANWSAEAARLAAALAVRVRDMKAPDGPRIEALCRDVWSEAVRLSARAVLDTALGGIATGDRLVEAVCSGAGRLGLASVALTPQIPVVAVGGPVHVYYGEVGKRLGCAMVFPPDCAVANAVGAATGTIARRLVIEITGNGSGAFRVHTPDGVEQFTAAAAALARAEAVGRAAARAGVIAMGGAEPAVTVSIEKHFLPDAVDDNGLFEAKVAVEAVAAPAAAVGRRAAAG